MAKIENPVTIVSGGESNAMFKALMDKTITEVKAVDFGSATKIENYAFNNCTLLRSLEIPNSVTSIGDYAFYGCSGLLALNIPRDTNNISRTAFLGCGGLESITVESGNSGYASSGNCLINKSNNGLMLGCKNSIIPTDGSVTQILQAAFRGCIGLTTITIPSTITKIVEYAFSGCTGLTDIEIPNGVTRIDYYTFSGCTGLTSVTIGSGVTSIGSNAFSGCSGLTSVTIPAGVTSVEWFAFANCINLKVAVIKNKNSVITGGNAPFLNSNVDLLIFVPLSLINDYKVATNWVTYTTKFRPAVDTVADLVNVDTTAYTEAWVYETEKEYSYDGTQWVEV